MTTESDTLKKIKELNDLTLELYGIGEKLKTYDLDFGLANQHLRDAIMGINKAMGTLMNDK